MTTKKLKQLFALAEELYCEEQKKSGMLSPIPYAYASNYDTNCCIFIAPWKRFSDRAKHALNKIAFEDEIRG